MRILIHRFAFQLHWPTSTYLVWRSDAFIRHILCYTALNCVAKLQQNALVAGMPRPRPTKQGRGRGYQSASSAQYERHSHSMVAGGLEVTSRTTRLTSGTELVMRVEMRARTS